MENIKLISGVETVATEKTMTSLELVDLINKVRKEEFEQGKTAKYVPIRHKNLFAKVPEVLGEALAAKFLASNKYQNGKGGIQERKIYKFPERESWLMAMSYSYTLQAFIYDALQEAFRCNHDLKTIANNLADLENRVSLNGSNWGKMGNEQKRNRQIIDRIANSLCDIVQLKLFEVK